MLNHLGIGVLPDYLIEDFPNLVRVLPDVESGDVPVFLAYPEELRQSKRIAAFRDFVMEEIIAYRKRPQADAVLGTALLSKAAVRHAPKRITAMHGSQSISALNRAGVAHLYRLSKAAIETSAAFIPPCWTSAELRARPFFSFRRRSGPICLRFRHAARAFAEKARRSRHRARAQSPGR